MGPKRKRHKDLDDFWASHSALYQVANVYEVFQVGFRRKEIGQASDDLYLDDASMLWVFLLGGAHTWRCVMP